MTPAAQQALKEFSLQDTPEATLEAQLVLPQAGLYRIVPPGVDADAVGMHYEFGSKLSGAMEDAVKNLIQGYEQGPKALEIRQ